MALRPNPSLATGPAPHHRALAAASAVALALVLALPAAGQHAHGEAAAVVIAHDAPASGRTYVGGLSAFAALDLGADDVPDVHQQNHLRVRQGDLTVFETTADSGHDYDGVAAFAVAFPAPGPYTVEALGADGSVLGSFEGVADLPANATVSATVLSVPAMGVAGRPVPIEVRVEGPGGLLPHTDAIVEVREGSDLLFRTHTHTHEEPQRLAYTFAEPGTYTVRATGYLAFASGGGPDIPQSVAEATVEVVPATPSVGAPPPVLAPSAQANAVVQAAAGDCTLVGTYDPFTQVGPATQQRLSVLVMQGHAPVQHIDFTARLTGPLGDVFASSSLHEYDGVLEVLAREPTPGAYLLAVEVDHGAACSGRIELPYHVLPAGAAPNPLVGGPWVVEVAAPPRLVEGTPATFTVAAHDLAGRPFAHGELDVAWTGADGRIGLLAKLHTHADGTFAFTAVPPGPGATTLRIAPSILGPGIPATFSGPDGASLDLALAVEADLAFQERSAFALSSGREVDGQASPAPALAVALAALALAAARRRQP